MPFDAKHVAKLTVTGERLAEFRAGRIWFTGIIPGSGFGRSKDADGNPDGFFVFHPDLPEVPEGEQAPELAGEWVGVKRDGYKGE